MKRSEVSVWPQRVNSSTDISDNSAESLTSTIDCPSRGGTVTPRAWGKTINRMRWK